MRNVVGLLVAAAVGIHCSAPAESSGDQSSAPELVTASPSTPPARQPEPEPDVGGPKTPDHLEKNAPDLSFLIEDPEHTQVTSTVVDPTTGALYATGTFTDRVVIGGMRLRSRGDKDVFLLKVDAGGRFAWVRSVGSASEESAPRVKLDGTSVNLVGMTAGAMDCGTGPLPTWSSATFFFCIFGGTDGTSLSGGVFPTGAP